MNSKLLIGSVLAGLFFFSQKKSSPKVTTSSKDDIVIEEEENVDEPQAEIPTYKHLTKSRKAIIDSYLTSIPLETQEPFPYGNYSAWGSDKQQNNIKPLYQDWLSNQIYWQISRLEGKTDLFTDLFGVDPQGYDGTLPYILQKGKKAIISMDDINLNPQIGGFKIVDITENSEQASKRLSKGINLWREIGIYVKSNFKTCPVGAVCA